MLPCKPIAALLVVLSVITGSLALAAEKTPSHEELKQIQEQLKGVKKKVKESARQEKNVLTDLEKINQSLEAKKTEVKKLEGKLGQVGQQMNATQSEMENYREKVQGKQSDLAARLREMYKTRRAGGEWVILLSGDYGSMLRRYKYLTAISERDQSMVQGYEESIDELTKNKEKLAVQKESFNKIKVARDTEAVKVQAQEQNKKELLESIRKQKSSYEAMARNLEEQSRRMQDLMRKLEAQARSKKNVRALPKNIPALTGGLDWPVTGTVVSFFGKQKHPVYDTYIYKKGIEIAAPAGSEVRAVEAGQVAFANFFKGLGLIAILRHGGEYYTVYAHLTNLKVKAGEKVNKGQPIAALGDAGPSGSSLYFEVRKGSEAIDPLMWLKRK
jgi:septal ring factor EnvC (AmiA/AmiB activator)